jgi:uncharacterized protein YndB with AHSA1/START domain
MRGKPGPSWSVSINAEPEKVYSYVADFSKHPEWSMDDMKIDAETPGALAVGSRYRAVGHLLGKPNPSTVSVTALDPPKSLEFEAEDKRAITGHVITFTPESGGTKVTRQIFGVKQPALGPLLLVLFKGAVNKNFNGALAKLKVNLEKS